MCPSTTCIGLLYTVCTANTSQGGGGGYKPNSWQHRAMYMYFVYENPHHTTPHHISGLWQWWVGVGGSAPKQLCDQAGNQTQGLPKLFSPASCIYFFCNSYFCDHTHTCSACKQRATTYCDHIFVITSLLAKFAKINYMQKNC